MAKKKHKFRHESQSHDRRSKPHDARPAGSRSRRSPGGPALWYGIGFVALIAAVLVWRAFPPPAPPASPTATPDTTSTSSRTPPASRTTPPPPPEPPLPASAGDAGGPAEIRASHVLVMHRESQRAPAGITRSRDEARARAEEVLRRARAGEDFAGLARTFSDEPGANTSGGDLNRFGHGMMVPPFDRAAFALGVGQISEIVETPFGFHVIRRTE